MTGKDKEYKYDWDILYIKCSKCWIYKSVDSFAKDKKWKFWVRNDCKECRNAYNKNYRFINKEELNKSRKVRVSEKSKSLGFNWETFHKKTLVRAKTTWVIPSQCAICWKEGKIDIHHPSYKANDWNKVVFCCKSCHKNIHNWTIECPKPIEI